MNVLLILIPAALFLGGMGLVGFIWCLRNRQFEDMDRHAEMILDDD